MASSTPRIDRLQRNLVINGNFDFFQRYTAATNASVTSFVADRFRHSSSGFTGTDVTQAKSTDVPFGDGNSLLIAATNTSATASGKLFGIIQPIEGTVANVANGRKVYLSFWVKANHAATYSAGLISGPSLQDSYCFPFTTVTNTWVKVEKLIDMAGIAVNGGIASAMTVLFELMASSDRLATANTWVNGNPAKRGLTGQANFWSSASNTIQFAKVMVIPVDTTTTTMTTDTNFMVRAADSYIGELAACQRYYEKSYNEATPPGTATVSALSVHASTTIGGSQWFPILFKVTKRAAATVVLYSRTTGASGNIRNETGVADVAASATSNDFGQNGFNVTSAITNGSQYSFHYTADAEL